ncbi:MAG: hypothetical protein M1834_005856 [Cirrosporium novae-zelandiae]|nr:MAG: hypothetical protein M1834_005856 [Cirrosporium novae-zelandiae]
MVKTIISALANNSNLMLTPIRSQMPWLYAPVFAHLPRNLQLLPNLQRHSILNVLGDVLLAFRRIGPPNRHRSPRALPFSPSWLRKLGTKREGCEKNPVSNLEGWSEELPAEKEERLKRYRRSVQQ